MAKNMVKADEALLLDPKQRNIQEILLNHGIAPQIARGIAQVELRNFTEEEVLTIFAKLRRHGPNLKTFEFDSATSWISSIANLLGRLELKADMWLKPSLEIVIESAKKGLALCVNAAGEWSLRENGYFALSHVWIEGIQADRDNRGMLLRHVQQIMKRIEATGAKWIWLDCLAIPGSSRALTLEEEELKVEIINNLHQIYKRAEAIIILDALVMQMQSVDFIDVAVGLSCGKWMTRVWTYQEIYLSSKALIMTGTGIVDYLTMCARLRSLSGLDDESSDLFASIPSHKLKGVQTTRKDNAKYESLYLCLARLLGVDGKKPSLTQLALSCRYRSTGNDIDYARAFFPILGLTWNSTLSREEGMELIYNSQTWYASRMLLMHGSPRSGFRPGWAPSYLTGLSGGPLRLEDHLGEMEWQKRGLKRNWYTYKIIEQHPGPVDNLSLIEINNEQESVRCAYLRSDKERTESIDGLQKAIGNGCAYLLANEELTDLSRNRLAYRAMLVERDDQVTEMNEAWVYMTVEVVPLDEPLQGKSASWLLLHESPISNHDRSGKPFSEIARMLSDEKALHEGMTSLHEAAEKGDEALLRTLLTSSKAMVTAQDKRGWTPLHAAAFMGQAKSTLILVQNGAPIDMEDLSGRSPLMLAASEGHDETVEQLLNLGANVNLSNKNAKCPLNEAILGGHTSIVRALLTAGANPNGRDEFGFAPLFVASNHSVEIFDLLISAGADPSADLVGGVTCLHVASRAGNDPLIKRLLQLGVAVDHTEGNAPDGYTALYRSVEGARRASAVSVLLQHGANPNHTVSTSWTPVLVAAKFGDYEITKMLIENGADTTTVCQPEGWTALHLASQEGHRLIVRLLLNAGWSINARDSSGHTPLQLAAAAGHIAVVEVLKKCGGR